jgi:DNA gyrase/topoisomerase IV subunit B
MLWEVAAYCLEIVSPDADSLIEIHLHFDRSIEIRFVGASPSISPLYSSNSDSVLFHPDRRPRRTLSPGPRPHLTGLFAVVALCTKVEIATSEFNVTQVQINPDSIGSKIGYSKEHNLQHWMIHFWPDIEVFGSSIIDINLLKKQVDILCYLNRSLTFHISEDQSKRIITHSYTHGSGILGYLAKRTTNRVAVHQPVFLSLSSDTDLAIDLAFQYVYDGRGFIDSYVNNFSTVYGGTHQIGVLLSLTSAINEFWVQRTGSTSPLTERNITRGLCCVLSVKIQDPEFEGSTSTLLSNQNLPVLLRQLLEPSIREHFKAHPQDIKSILQHLTEEERPQ